MNNGIKPTRLWHLTGKKHFRDMIYDRLTSCCNTRGHGVTQRGRSDVLMLYGLVLAQMLGTAYSFGVFSPHKDCLEKQKAELAKQPKGKCTPPKVKDPCPPVASPKPQPECPTCDDNKPTKK